MINTDKQVFSEAGCNKTAGIKMKNQTGNMLNSRNQHKNSHTGTTGDECVSYIQYLFMLREAGSFEAWIALHLIVGFCVKVTNCYIYL